jgi:hypothetical protein
MKRFKLFGGAELVRDKGGFIAVHTLRRTFYIDFRAGTAGHASADMGRGFCFRLAQAAEVVMFSAFCAVILMGVLA